MRAAGYALAKDWPAEPVAVHRFRPTPLKVEARLDADEGRALLDALEGARSQIREDDPGPGGEDGPAGPPEDGGSAEPPEPLLGDVATNADALSLIAESFFATSDEERGRYRWRSASPYGSETKAAGFPAAPTAALPTPITSSPGPAAAAPTSTT